MDGGGGPGIVNSSAGSAIPGIVSNQSDIVMGSKFSLYTQCLFAMLETSAFTAQTDAKMSGPATLRMPGQFSLSNIDID